MRDVLYLWSWWMSWDNTRTCIECQCPFWPVLGFLRPVLCRDSCFECNLWSSCRLQNPTDEGPLFLFETCCPVITRGNGFSKTNRTYYQTNLKLKQKSNCVKLINLIKKCLTITITITSTVHVRLKGSPEFYYRPQRSWGKVMFLQVCVILFTGGVPD